MRVFDKGLTFAALKSIRSYTFGKEDSLACWFSALEATNSKLFLPREGIVSYLALSTPGHHL